MYVTTKIKTIVSSFEKRVKTTSLMNYPADKDQYKVNTRRDGQLLSSEERYHLYRDDVKLSNNLEVESSLTFEFPHEVVFKRLSIKQSSAALFEDLIADTRGQLCLEIDGKPVAGAAGCNPIADYERLELSWEDHHMRLGMVGDYFCCAELHLEALVTTIS